jgi:hypothetical protein
MRFFAPRSTTPEFRPSAPDRAGGVASTGVTATVGGDQRCSIAGMTFPPLESVWPLLLVIGTVPLLTTWLVRRVFVFYSRHGRRIGNRLAQWALFTVRHFLAYGRHTLHGTYQDSVSMTSIEIHRPLPRREPAFADESERYPWNNDDFLVRVVRDNIRLRNAIG